MSVCLSRVSIFAAISMFCAMPVHAADKIMARSGFDSDAEGWSATQPGDVTWSAGGGNPGGRMVFTDLNSGGCYLIAPGGFLSGSIDYAKLNGRAYISWQHELVRESDVTGEYHYEIVLSGPGGTAQFDGGVPPLDPLNQWYTVAAPLVQADWTVTSGSWSALLADVESMQIKFELVENGATNDDVEAIDNVEIVSHLKGFNPIPK